jgi:outer membrane lipoprotein-sorting protein
MKHNKSNRDFEIYFDKNNNQIKSIKILEENNIVYINFNNIMNVNKFDKNLFRIKNIDIFGPPQRLNAQSIEKFFK